MVPLASLWLPILLSAVIVFFASFILHMVLPWHKNDYARVPDEEKVRAALRPFAIPPGDYMVPRPQSREEMRAPEFAARVAEGPNMVVTVLPNGGFSMGRNLALWFVYLVAVAVFAGYVAGRALPLGRTTSSCFVSSARRRSLGSRSRSGRCRSGIGARGGRR